LHRNCLLQHAIERKIEATRAVTGRRRGKRKQFLDYYKEERGYWRLKEETFDSIVWRTRFGTGYELDVREATERVTCDN
jgi:hypothetical protein